MLEPVKSRYKCIQNRWCRI